MSVLPHCSSCAELIPKIATFNAGRLELIMGPMFSGKSSKLIHEITTLADQGMKVLYINHAMDVRSSEGDEKFSTHSSHFRGLSNKIETVKVATLAEVEQVQNPDLTNFDVIGVDEGQFFSDLIDNVTHWVTDFHKIVFVAGLDGDARRQPFGQILPLIPHCDNVTKLKARCHHCLQNSRSSALDSKKKSHLMASLVDAPFTGRLKGGNEQTVVGGSDLYLPLCRYHHDKHLRGELTNSNVDA
jgi:thymidine kinase